MSFTVFVPTSLCVCVRYRSDSDSEGENPEKKKLQEQLMGEEISMGATSPHRGIKPVDMMMFNQHGSLIQCI